MTDYRRRILDDELDALLAHWPAVAIAGMVGVGKTSTARRRAATVHDVGDPATRAGFTLEPRRFDTDASPILVDDWILDGHSYDLVRRSIDRQRAPGRFVLTADGQAMHPRKTSERDGIVHVHMHPLSLAERGLPEAPTVSLAALLAGNRGPIDGACTVTLGDYADEIVASGLPGIRSVDPAERGVALDDYLAQFERDATAIGRRVVRQGTFRAFLAAYLDAVSTSRAIWAIAEGAGSESGARPSDATMIAYRDMVSRMFVIDPVLDLRNPVLRVSKRGRHSLKHQVTDPALAAHALGLSADDLRRPTLRSPGTFVRRSRFAILFESLVTLSLRVYAQPARAAVRHLGAISGDRVIDLLVEGADGRLVAVDTTLAATVHDGHAKNLNWLLSAVDPGLVADRIIVSTGDRAYRRPDGIAVVPAALLGP